MPAPGVPPTLPHVSIITFEPTAHSLLLLVVWVLFWSDLGCIVMVWDWFDDLLSV